MVREQAFLELERKEVTKAALPKSMTNLFFSTYRLNLERYLNLLLNPSEMNNH